MTRTQWLLTQLASEAGEVAHAATKAIQFGLDDNYPGYGHTTDRLVAELNDLTGVINILQREGLLPGEVTTEEAVKAKMVKVEKMYQYAKERGVVE